MDSRRGQATVELLAALPALLLAGLICLQLLVLGYSVTVADGAAEAGALAVATGAPASAAARAALPGWAENDFDVTVSGRQVTVRLRPPSFLGPAGHSLAITSSAAARPKP